MPWRLRFAKPSSTSAPPLAPLGILVGAVVVFSIVAVVGIVLGSSRLAASGLAAAIAIAGALVFLMVAAERRRHERQEEALAQQASFLESLVDAIGRIAPMLDSDKILEQTCREAERLFGARASLLEQGQDASPNGAVVVPLRVRDEQIAAIRLEREQPFERWDVVRARVLADFAARATENARLLAEAKVREAERALLSDQLITAEQEERRRLALFLHDTAVQSLSGIGLLLEHVLASIGDGEVDEARGVLASALDRQRQTVRSLRDLSFELEPVVLRDQGFGPAVRALAEQVGLSRGIQIDLDVEAADALAEKAQVALYQIIRDALHLAIRRGPPNRIDVRIGSLADGSVEAVVSDDGAGERRRASFDAIAERARSLSGNLVVDAGEDGGTAVHVILPAYVARR
jgi:signal transduction histidine kinase